MRTIGLVETPKKQVEKAEMPAKPKVEDVPKVETQEKEEAPLKANKSTK